jgi:hypothetical protein
VEITISLILELGTSDLLHDPASLAPENDSPAPNVYRIYRPLTLSGCSAKEINAILSVIEPQYSNPYLVAFVDDMCVYD